MNEPKPIEAPSDLERRRFLAQLSVILGSLGALILAIPMVGFIFAPLFRKAPGEWRNVGKVDDFKIGETVSVTFLDAAALPWAGVSAKAAAWLRRESENHFIAFTVHCAHLGCPVRWLPDADLFMCPCHGGVYYKDGSVAAGPPPHGLAHYPVRVLDGCVQIMSSPIPISTAM